MNARNYGRHATTWLLVMLMASTTVWTTWGCNPKSPVTGYHTDVVILEPNDPAPFKGVLIAPGRWIRIYERLLECEE